MSETLRKRVNTRARLLEAGIEVFADKGIDGTSVDELASAAGFTKGAFYSNFTDKLDMFFTIFEQETERLIGKVRDVVEKIPFTAGVVTTAEQSRMLVGEVFATLRPDGQRWHLLQREADLYALRNPEHRERLSLHRNRLTKLVVEIIGVELAKRETRSTIPLDLLGGLITAIFLQELADEHLGLRSGEEDYLTQIMSNVIEAFTE